MIDRLYFITSHVTISIYLGLILTSLPFLLVLQIPFWIISGKSIFKKTEPVIEWLMMKTVHKEVRAVLD